MSNSKPSVRQRVESILSKFKSARDNDMFLLGKFWEDETKSKVINLDYLRSGLMTSPETIRRARQIVQQDKPSLRGKKYRARQAYNVF